VYHAILRPCEMYINSLHYYGLECQWKFSRLTYKHLCRGGDVIYSVARQGLELKLTPFGQLQRRLREKSRPVV